MKWEKIDEILRWNKFEIELYSFIDSKMLLISHFPSFNLSIFSLYLKLNINKNCGKRNEHIYDLSANI